MTSKTDFNKKKKFPIISICFLGFIISIFFEFYWINYFPYDYFMLFGIGIILCIFGYLTIDALVDMIHQNAERREAQNEVMIKASKAIYVTAKKIITETQQSGAGAASSTKNLQALLNDLTLANERLARELESAASLQIFKDEEPATDEAVMESTTDEPELQSVSETQETDVVSAETVGEDVMPTDEAANSTTDEASPETTSEQQETEDVTNNQNQKLTEEQIAKMFADL